LFNNIDIKVKLKIMQSEKQLAIQFRKYALRLQLLIKIKFHLTLVDYFKA